MNEFRRIKKKWQEYAPHQWWGDSIDVRFYLISQLKSLRNQRVLDVGCNAGLMLSELDGSNVQYGFDIDFEVLRIARTVNPQSHLLNASLFDSFPFQDQSFDIVIMANVMPYHEILDEKTNKEEQKAKVLNEVFRVLKPGGTLFLTTLNGKHFCYRHTRKIHLPELVDAFKCFEKVQIYGWNPLPSLVFFLPVFLKSRIPPKYHKYVFVPSPLLARIPYMMSILRYLMPKKGLLRQAKAFYVECEKG